MNTDFSMGRDVEEYRFADLTNQFPAFTARRHMVDKLNQFIKLDAVEIGA